jgi:hypothetical protein
MCTYLRGARKRGKPARNVRYDSGPSPSSTSNDDTQLQVDLPAVAFASHGQTANIPEQRRWEQGYQTTDSGQARTADRLDPTRYAAPELAANGGQQAATINANFLCKSRCRQLPSMSERIA